MSVQVYPDADALARAGAELWIKEAPARVVLSGGHTPKKLYTLLAQPPFREAIDWTRVDFFWGDERWVPPDHIDSNFRMAWESLLAPLQIPDARIHRFRTELGSPELVAQDYERQLRPFFRDGGPAFDLVWMGLGFDGHTASLFPEIDRARFKPGKKVSSYWVGSVESYRLTMTPEALSDSKKIAFLTAGNQKSHIVAQVLQGHGRYPAEWVSPREGEVLWLLDQASARELSA